MWVSKKRKREVILLELVKCAYSIHGWERLSALYVHKAQGLGNFSWFSIGLQGWLEWKFAKVYQEIDI